MQSFLKKTFNDQVTVNQEITEGLSTKNPRFWWYKLYLMCIRFCSKNDWCWYTMWTSIRNKNPFGNWAMEEFPEFIKEAGEEGGASNNGIIAIDWCKKTCKYLAFFCKLEVCYHLIKSELFLTIPACVSKRNTKTCIHSYITASSKGIHQFGASINIQTWPYRVCHI